MTNEIKDFLEKLEELEVKAGILPLDRKTDLFYTESNALTDKLMDYKAYLKDKINFSVLDSNIIHINQHPEFKVVSNGN